MSLKESAYDEFVATQKTIGTAVVQLFQKRIFGKVTLTADAGNAGTIYIGSTAAVNSTTGFPLLADEFVDVHIDDLSKIFVVASGSGQVLKIVGA